MTIKQKRNEIYIFIVENIGKMDNKISSDLSDHLKELCKIHNGIIFEELNLLQKAHKVLKDSIGNIKIAKKEPIKIKPAKKKDDEPFFNRDFLQR